MEAGAAKQRYENAFWNIVSCAAQFNENTFFYETAEVRLAEMSSMGIGNKPCLDIRPSADQINDRSISVAQLSKSKFAIYFHKYFK